MKRILAFLLCISLIISNFSGCSNKTKTETVPIPTEVIIPTETKVEISTVETTEPTTIPSPTLAEESIPEMTPPVYELNDPALLQRIEDDVYANLEEQLGSDDFIIEGVTATYISKEYLDEMAYNSQANIYFGYTQAELDSIFQGDKYIFKLNADGTTGVEKMQIIEDDTYERILRNVLIGSGVILVCVTVSIVSAGAGAPVVSAVFAASAKSGAIMAASTGAFSATSAGLVKGLQTGDWEEALKTAALAGSEGFKMGAITGAISGGMGKLHSIKHPKSIPTPREAELHAAKKLSKCKEQCSYLNGKEVPYGTPGSTRPDLIREVSHLGKKGLEAVEVKRYDIANPNNLNSLCNVLEKQVSQRIIDLPAGTTQRIVLNVQNRNYSQKIINNAISTLRGRLGGIYNNIPIQIMG